MSIRVYHVAGLSPRLAATSSQENFQGRLQGLVVNGERILDEAHLKQVEYEGKQDRQYFFFLYYTSSFRQCKVPTHGGFCVQTGFIHLPPHISGPPSAQGLQHD